MKWIIFLICSFVCAEEEFSQVVDKSELKILSPSLSSVKTAKIKLKNGLLVYLISDSQIEESAAALALSVGSWNDPKNYPGMAHFLEHMLFKGTKKYPEEAEFMRFIWHHGGEVNAMTFPHMTVYGFSINNERFLDALDRFAPFFICPLFNPSGIGRELYAVDQEHEKNVENDEWRKMQIEKELANPKHPFCKFSTGNSKTLKNIPQEEMKKWYETYYGADCMRLVIYSSKSIEELIKIAVEKFKEVPVSKAKVELISEKIFPENSVEGHMLYIKPVKNVKRLCLEWEMDKKFVNDESKSLELISYVIKRGQKNSLEEYLKEKGLIENLDVGSYKIFPHALFFGIDMKLTDKGVENIQSVIKSVFEELAFLKEKNIPKYLFNEMNDIAQLEFQYQSRKKAFDFAIEQASNLMEEDFATYPQKTYIASNYSKETIAAMLNNLTQQKCLFCLLVDPLKTGIKMEKKEKWLGGEYAIKEISPVALEQNSFCKLPEANPFIPTNFELKGNDKEIKDPKKVITSNCGKIFFVKDNFNLPQVSYLLNFKTPLLDNSKESSALLDLYVKILLKKMAPSILAAQSAGLNFALTPDLFSLKMEISGFDEKAPLLLKEVLQELKEGAVSNELFASCREDLLKDLQNREKSLPLLQAYEQVYSLLLKVPEASEEMQALQNTSYEDFLKFQKRLFAKTYVEGFFSGNIALKEIDSLWVTISSILKSEAYPERDHFKKLVLQLPPKKGPFVIFNRTKAKGNGIILALDEGNFSHDKKASSLILSQVLKEAFFTSLRSKQKTAYIARSEDREIEKRLFQLFAVESNSHTPINLLTRFDIFLEDFEEELSSYISESKFNDIKKSQITLLKAPPKNLEEMMKKFNMLAFDYDEDFEWINKTIQSLEKLSYNDFLTEAKSFLSKKNRKRVAVCFTGKLGKKNQFRYQPSTLKKMIAY